LTNKPASVQPGTIGIPSFYIVINTPI